MYLVKKSIDRKRPFDRNGNGFRDSLLWEHVLKELQSASFVSLISNDLKAFAETDQAEVIASDLAAELKSLGFAEDAVRLYPSVAAYLGATGTVDLESYEAVAAIIANDRAQLSINLMIAIGRARIAGYNTRARMYLEKVLEPTSIEFVDVTVPDDSKLSLVTLQGDVDVELYVEWSDDDGHDLSGSTTSTIAYTATATYGHDAHILGDLSVGDVHVDLTHNDIQQVRYKEWTPVDLLREITLFGGKEET